MIKNTIIEQGTGMMILPYIAYSWQDEEIGRFLTKEKAWKYLDGADLSGYVKHISEEIEKDKPETWQDKYDNY